MLKQLPKTAGDVAFIFFVIFTALIMYESKFGEHLTKVATVASPKTGFDCVKRTCPVCSCSPEQCKCPSCRDRAAAGVNSGERVISKGLTFDNCVAGDHHADLSMPESLDFLVKENAGRADWYLDYAEKKFEQALNQMRGIDTTNEDPFVAGHEGMLQVFAATQLGKDDADTLYRAGFLTAAGIAFTEDEAHISTAVSLITTALSMDINLKHKLKTSFIYLKQPEFSEVRKQLKSALREGKVRKFGENAVENKCRGEQEETERPMGTVNTPWAQKLHNSFESRSIFTTLMTVSNIRNFVPDGFLEAISKLAVDKYTKFSQTILDQNPDEKGSQINDAFFGEQDQQDFWPEFYGSKWYPMSLKIMKVALLEFVKRVGNTAKHTITEENMMVTQWAAVYFANQETKHMYHVHQQCFASCVLYAQSEDASTPIMFGDPRGFYPGMDYETFNHKSKTNPKAPFHHPYTFFPKSGDLICFPSWLVHRVPPHQDKTPRVAFPANLRAAEGFEDFGLSWYMSAQL